MRVFKVLIAVSVVWLVGVGTAAAHPRRPDGQVQLKVVDLNGASVIGAPVYIYGRQILELPDVRSGDKLHLPEGDYSMSAAWIQKTKEGIIPQLSPLAHIHVTSGDTVFVILPLAAAISQGQSAFVGPLAFSSR